MNTVIFITGASSGFGKLTAKKLVENKQNKVYATARGIDKMQDLKELGATIIKVDVTKNEDVTNAVQKIIEKEGKIDVLLANAGFGAYGMIEAIPLKDIKYQYEVNVFGVARCVQAVLPHMRKQKAGRIVITESLASYLSTLGLGWYASTKQAVKGMSSALRQEVKSFGIDVISIRPGIVDTGFDEVAYKTFKNTQHPEDYKELTDDYYAYLVDSFNKAHKPNSTVNAIIKAITSKKPKAVYRTTPDAKLLSKFIPILPVKLFDSIMLYLVKRAGKKKRKK